MLRPALLPILCLLSLFLAGCGLPVGESQTGRDDRPAERTLADGVVYRRVGQVGLIEVDLRRARVGVASQTAREQARTVGRARTAADWLALRGDRAVAAVNGGFFGATRPDGRLDVLGLLVRDGRVLSSAPLGHGSRLPGKTYARSAVGFDADGYPEIVWATSEGRDNLRRHSEPLDRASGDGRPWRVREAIGCGPRLIAGGEIRVSDRAERLVSEGKRPRTFIGYDVGADGRPRRMVLAVAPGFDFDDCAAFLDRYFRSQGSRCREAMALDGGSSSQIAVRDGAGGRVREPYALGVPVPTALVVTLR